jgi:hypothetical protein
MQNVPKAVRRRFMETIDGQAVLPQKAGLAPLQRRFELLILLLNSGNESNLERLTEGRGFTEQQLRDAAEKVGVTTEEMGWVQSVWDAAEAIGKEAFDLEERDTGIRPEKIQAKPFTMNGVTYRGGYFPAVYDRDVTLVGAQQELKQFQDPSYTRPGTARGHLKGRVDGYTNVISLEVESIPRHFQQVAHDIAFREAVRSVGKLVLDQDVHSALVERLGADRASQFVQWVKDVGQMRGIEGAVRTRAFMGAMRYMRGALAVTALGYSVQNVLEDLTSNLAGAVAGSDLKPQYLAAGIAAVKGYSQEAMADAEAKSGELRSRRGQLQRELMHTINSLTASGPLARGPLKFYKDHAFIMQEMVDRSTSSALWIGRYRQALEDGASEADAIELGNKLVNTLLPSHHAVDQAALLRDKGPIGMALVFFNAFNTFYNVQRRFGPKLLPQNLEQGARMFGYMVAIFVLGNLARGHGPEPGEEWARWFARKMAAGTLQLLPFGDVAAGYLEARMTGKRSVVRNNTLTGMGVEIFEQAQKAADGDRDALKRLEALVRMAGLTTGVPTSQLIRTGNGVRSWFEGAHPPRNPLEAASDVAYGRREGQPANLPALAGEALEGQPR